MTNTRPPETPPGSDPAETLDRELLLRATLAVERFEIAWRRGEPMTLEDLLRGEESPAARAAPLSDAPTVERHYRRACGESPAVERNSED